MAKHLLVVMSNAADGRDAEYNQWYNETHLRDVLGVDGFVAAQRFELAPLAAGAESPTRYLAIYEIETDDLDAALDGLMNPKEAMVISDALADPLALVATPITARVTG